LRLPSALKTVYLQTVDVLERDDRMRGSFLFYLKMALLVLGGAALFTGIALGEWREVLFNAALL